MEWANTQISKENPGPRKLGDVWKTGEETIDTLILIPTISRLYTSRSKLPLTGQLWDYEWTVEVSERSALILYAPF